MAQGNSSVPFYTGERCFSVILKSSESTASVTTLGIERTSDGRKGEGWGSKRGGEGWKEEGKDEVHFGIATTHH